MAVKFGEDIRKEFMYDEGYVHLNHGSYGGVPKRVFEARNRIQQEIERLPDDWYRRHNPRHHHNSLKALCDVIEARPNDLVFVENVTVGMNAVCRSLTWEPDDVILVTNLTYHAVHVMANEFGQVVKLDLGIPESKQQILEKFKVALMETKVKLVIIAHITSPSSVVLPVADIASLCHTYGAVVMVDGAHAPGQLQVNMADLGVDFYTGNLHKWFFTPRGCAFLWVDPKHQACIRPAVISHFHGLAYHYDFFVRGTRDDSPYHTIPEAVRFSKELGGLKAIAEYNSSLLDQAVADIERAWGTKQYAIPAELRAPYMRLVQVPHTDKYDKTPIGAGELDTTLYEKYKIFTCCMCVSGQLYIRLSAHVHNTLRDYEILRDAVLEIIKEPGKHKLADKGYDLPIMHWDLSSLTPLNQ